jgi:hypothetical protein
MTATVWTPPALWSVPREWVGERCYILCGGSSLVAQRTVIPNLKGRVIAIKQSVLLRPDADVMFIAGEKGWEICRPIFPKFRGRYIVARGRSDARFPPETKRIGRNAPDVLSHDPTMVTGYDAGTSAINLAYLFGAKEVILLGFDMCGGHWCASHPMPFPPQEHFRRHLSVLPRIAADLSVAGVRVVNCSPTSAVAVFERGRLEEWV